MLGTRTWMGFRSHIGDKEGAYNRLTTFRILDRHNAITSNSILNTRKDAKKCSVIMCRGKTDAVLSSGYTAFIGGEHGETHILWLERHFSMWGY